MLRKILVSASLLALAACTVGPDHVPPRPSISAVGAFVSAGAQGTVQAPVIEGEWWRLYEDPVLDGLVADALAANTDIRVAVARLERARASLREVRAERGPQLSVGGSAGYGRQPEGQRAPGADSEDFAYDVGADLSYEVDLFGRLGRQAEAARGDLAAADGDLNAARILVAAETARAYADAASAADQQALAERIVGLLDQAIALTERRRSVGIGTALDIARIRALREQRQAQVPVFAAEREAALFRLATLTGRAPRDLPLRAGARRVPLALSRPIPVGDGAGLLARRPDVRAAEQRLAAATARIGVATADLYPRISLGASIGSTGADLGDVLTGGPLRWAINSLLGWTVNRAPARARIAAAEAEAQEALARFDGAVLGALEETEAALSGYGRLLQRREALQAARSEAERAVRITRVRLQEGDINSLELLDAERTFADAEAELARVDALVTGAQTQLFRALGGGWQNSRLAGR